MSKNIFEKRGILYYIQVDHLCGEDIGTCIENFYEAGAKNVQVIATVTKKNRPGFLFLIDVLEDNAEMVEKTIIRELNVSGWHRIDTKHCYLAVDYLQKKVRICVGNSQIVLETEAKKIYGEYETVRPEHRSCEDLQNRLKEYGKNISLTTCRELLSQVWLQKRAEIFLGGKRIYAEEVPEESYLAMLDGQMGSEEKKEKTVSEDDWSESVHF